MSTGTIYFDNQSGHLIEGKVWNFEIYYPNEPGIVHGVCGGEGNTIEVKNCPLVSEHVTEIIARKVSVALGGSILCDFVPIWDWPHIIVSAEFCNRLALSSLTAYECRDNVVMANNQSGDKNSKVLSLAFCGTGGHNSRIKVVGAPNLCPHCKTEPMVCPGCGNQNWPRCRNCARLTLYRPDSPDYSDPDGFTLDAALVENYLPIIEATAWDGSDFFVQGDSPFISDRAKRWMEGTGAFPIRFKPALLNIEGMEDKFLTPMN